MRWCSAQARRRLFWKHNIYMRSARTGRHTIYSYPFNYYLQTADIKSFTFVLNNISGFAADPAVSASNAPMQRVGAISGAVKKKSRQIDFVLCMSCSLLPVPNLGYSRATPNLCGSSEASPCALSLTTRLIATGCTRHLDTSLCQFI
jgi:hypothetical protein